MWPGKNGVYMMDDVYPPDATRELIDYEFGQRSNDRPKPMNDAFEEIARRSVRNRR